MATENEEVKDEADESGTRRLDPELRVLGQVIRLIESQEEPARGRMMQYLADRYAEKTL